MPGERLVLNPMLNFISQARNAGCSADNIVKIGCDFFKGDMLIEAKKILLADASITRVTEHPKVTDNVSDMVQAFDLCDEKKISLPQYLIFEPDQVPCVPGETTATLTQKVNELYMEFKSFAEHHKARSVVQTIPEMKPPPPAKPSYSVIVKNPPKNLNNPDARKDFLDKACGGVSSSIGVLRPRRDAWQVVLSDKGAANTLADALSKADQSINAKVKSPAFFGIVRRVPDGTSKSDLCDLANNCIEVVQLGSTRSFRLKFESRDHLNYATENPLVIGYERLPITEYKFLPTQFYKCQCYGHTANNCKASPRCSKCAGDHQNSKENPCQLVMKCALCGSSDHPCYSYKCPEAQKQLLKK